MFASQHQAPGFYRHALGRILVTCLNDGVLAEDPGILSGTTPEAAAAALEAAFLPPVPMVTVNGFLVQMADATVLIDAGCGDGMGPGAGRLVSNLAQAGLAPTDITHILLTHMHPDHIGGLLDPAGQAVFPGARVSVAAADAAVFLDAALAERVPAGAKPVFAKARAVAAAYAGRFTTFEDGAEILPGLHAVSLPGHSPGHTGFRIADDGTSLLLWGDVVHVPGLQFSQPGIGVVFDADPIRAEATRRTAFEEAAARRELVGGMHLPFPGLVHVARDADAFRMLPILWNPTVRPLGQPLGHTA